MTVVRSDGTVLTNQTMYVNALKYFNNIVNNLLGAQVFVYLLVIHVVVAMVVILLMQILRALDVEV